MIRADIPGVGAEDISVDYEKGTLKLYGKVKPRQTEGVRHLLHEYSVGDFYRAFEINQDVKVEGITAECSNGVLNVQLPKAEAAKPKKIAVVNR